MEFGAKFRITKFFVFKFFALICNIPFQIFAYNYLLHIKAGYVIFEYSFLPFPILIIFVSALFGEYLDTRNRKKLLLSTMLIWLISVLLILFLNLLSVFTKYEAVVLMLYFSEIIAVPFWLIFSPFLNTISEDSSKVVWNSVSEIASQVTNMLGGIFVIIIASIIDFYTVTIFYILTLGIATYIVSRIEYNHERIKNRIDGGNNAAGLTKTVKFLISNRGSLIFIFLISFPILITAYGNLLKPIMIVSLFNGGLSSIAVSETVYSFGGVVISIFIYMNRKAAKFTHAVLIMILYGSLTLILSFTRDFYTFILLQFAFGTLSPASRIIRNSIVMERVDDKENGKFFSSLSLLVSSAQFTGFMLFSRIVNAFNIRYVFLLLSIMDLLFAIVVFIRRSYLFNKIGEITKNSVL